MNVTVYPGRAEGIISAPPCIDEVLLACVLASITRTGVRHPGNSSEIEQLLNALSTMGAKYRRQNNTILFYDSVKQSNPKIECGIDIAMLLFPLCAAVGGECLFIGDYGADTAVMLAKAGIKFEVCRTGVKIYGMEEADAVSVNDKRLLPGLLLSMPVHQKTVNYSGSYKDALLPLYILKNFGYSISETNGYSIKHFRRKESDYIYSAGGDYSHAAYMLLPGIISGEIGVTGLLSDSVQPGKSVIEELKGFGLSISDMNGAVFAKKKRLKSETIDISEAAEPVLLLVLCCFAKGNCVIKNAGLLHDNKEEEFRQALSSLKSIGADIASIGADLFVNGADKLFGGTADAKGSIKLSFAFAAAALRSETAVTIQNCADLSALRTLGISL